jgi:hypothetical protein
MLLRYRVAVIQGYKHKITVLPLPQPLETSRERGVPLIIERREQQVTVMKQMQIGSQYFPT